MYFPEYPDDYFGILHPAYDYQPIHSVLTHVYQMEYEYDHVNILSPNHIDWSKTMAWTLDDEIEAMDSCPHLTVVSLLDVQSHILLIPYHAHSKFKLGVVSQFQWADKFVTY